jgi:hypothetical protein
MKCVTRTPVLATGTVIKIISREHHISDRLCLMSQLIAKICIDRVRCCSVPPAPLCALRSTVTMLLFARGPYSPSAHHRPQVNVIKSFFS